MRRLALFSIVFLVCVMVHAQKQTRLSVPIAMTGIRPMDAFPEQICCGIPLPAGVEVRDPARLRLVDSENKTVPARIRALSRRSATRDDISAPLDWVEVCFGAKKERRGRLYLQETEEAAPPGSLKLEEADGKTVLHWNRLELLFDPKAAALLTSVRRDGVEITAGPSLRPWLRDVNGEPVSPEPWTLWVEAAESHAVTMLASTHIAGLLFQMRLQFVDTSPDARIDVRLVNEGPYGHMGGESSHAWFKSLSLTLPRLKTASELSDGNLVFDPKAWALLQQHATATPDGEGPETFAFQVFAGGKHRLTADRSDGCFALGTDKLSCGYGLEHFWQNAPKTWSVHEKAVLCGLFPEGGSGPRFKGKYGRPGGEGEVDPLSLANYRFEGARAKSFRIHWSITEQSPAASAKRTRLITTAPQHAIVSPDSLGERRLLGYLPLSHTTGFVDRAAAVRFERFCNLWVDDSPADVQPALGQIGYPEFVRRGGTYGRSVFHGWFNFGDIPWGDGYCSLHYDIVFSTLFNYLRTGDHRFLTLGVPMARHRRDIDQDHDRTSDSNRRGGQFYEKGWYHGNYYHPHASHTWVRGPLLHYLLTGDTWSLEAAELNREFIRRAVPENWSGDWGSRIPGWNIDNLLCLHEVLGHADDLRMAGAVVKRFEKLEKSRKSSGYVINRRMKPPSWKPWMHNIFFNAAALYRLRTGDKSVDPLLDRMAATFRASVLQKSPGGPWRAARNMVGAKRDRPSTNLLWPMAASFALLSEIHGRKADRSLATELFRDAAQWFQEKQQAPLAFRVLMYPNSESKIHGGIQLWGLLALPALSP